MPYNCLQYRTKYIGSVSNIVTSLTMCAKILQTLNVPCLNIIWMLQQRTWADTLESSCAVWKRIGSRILDSMQKSSSSKTRNVNILTGSGKKKHQGIICPSEMSLCKIKVGFLNQSTYKAKVANITLALSRLGYITSSLRPTNSTKVYI